MKLAAELPLYSCLVGVSLLSYQSFPVVQHLI